MENPTRPFRTWALDAHMAVFNMRVLPMCEVWGGVTGLVHFHGPFFCVVRGLDSNLVILTAEDVFVHRIHRDAAINRAQ